MAAELYKNGRVFTKLTIAGLNGMVKRCGHNSKEHNYDCNCECGRNTIKPQSYFQKKTIKHQCEECAKTSKFKGHPLPIYNNKGMNKEAVCGRKVFNKRNKNLEYGEDPCLM